MPFLQTTMFYRANVKGGNAGKGGNSKKEKAREKLDIKRKEK